MNEMPVLMAFYHERKVTIRYTFWQRGKQKESKE
jgi:hypothetical protein